MSTFLNDVPSKAQLRQAIPPQNLNEAVTGEVLELPDGDGPTFAVLMVGRMIGAAIIRVSFEQSETGLIWLPIPGATIPDQGENTVFAVSFLREQRYIRCQCEILGDEESSAQVAVLLGQAIKFL